MVLKMKCKTPFLPRGAGGTYTFGGVRSSKGRKKTVTEEELGPVVAGQANQGISARRTQHTQNDLPACAAPTNEAGTPTLWYTQYGQALSCSHCAS